MAIRTELSIRLPNSPGSLGRVCDVLAGERINILALMLESDGVARLVVDNHVHAAGVLREHHYQVQLQDVLFVDMPNDPGALAKISRLLGGANINVDYAYGTAIEGGPGATVVVGVPDAQRASAAAGV